MQSIQKKILVCDKCMLIEHINYYPDTVDVLFIVCSKNELGDKKKWETYFITDWNYIYIYIFFFYLSVLLYHNGQIFFKTLLFLPIKRSSSCWGFRICAETIFGLCSFSTKNPLWVFLHGNYRPLDLALQPFAGQRKKPLYTFIWPLKSGGHKRSNNESQASAQKIFNKPGDKIVSDNVLDFSDWFHTFWRLK